MKYGFSHNVHIRDWENPYPKPHALCKQSAIYRFRQQCFGIILHKNLVCLFFNSRFI